MSWFIDGGYPDNTQFIDAPEKPQSELPRSQWRIVDGENDGYPWFDLLPEIPPIHIDPVNQKPYICVYDKRTEKADFLSNGLAILIPTVCDVTETLNGAWTVQMQHPIDPEGRWQLLIISNILKINDQLFTIKSVDPQFTGNSGSVSVYAEHIFYQLNDGWIFPPAYLTGSSGQAAINNIMSRIDYQARPGAFIYSYIGSSDITTPLRREVSAGCTPIDALLGGGGLAEKCSGELYRDNFYFSINSRMENAKDNAFDIRVGKNLRGIRRTVDMTSMATYFRGYDAWGGWLAVAWDFEAFFGDLFPHYVVRSENFSKPQNADDEDFDYDDYYNNTFIPEVMAFFRRNCKPIVRYEIDLEDVRHNPDFKITSDERFRVGDKGTVYDVRLGGALTIELTETVYDAVHDKYTRIAIGDRQSFVQTASPLIVVDIAADPIQSVVPVLDASGALCYDASGEQIFEERRYT